MKNILIPTNDQFPSSADAVIIGGGIVGVASAFWMARAGLTTVLIEMRDALCTLTSANSFESLRSQFATPPLIEMTKESIAFYEHFAKFSKTPDYDIGFQNQGYLYLTDRPRAVDKLKQSVIEYKSLGVRESEFLTPPQLQQRFPFVSETAVAGIYHSRGSWLSPPATIKGLTRACDAQFLLKTKAIKLQQDAQGICGVLTNRGSISTRIVVNAAGPFAGQLAQQVGIDLPLKPTRRQRAYFPTLPQAPSNAPMTINVTSGAYWRPKNGGAYLAFGEPDDPVGNPSETLPTDSDFPRRAIAAMQTVCPFWRDVGINLKHTPVKVSAGQLVYTPDDLPLIGAVENLPGLYLNCGHWAGFILGPASGKLLTTIINSTDVEIDNPCDPTRFDKSEVPFRSTNHFWGWD